MKSKGLTLIEALIALAVLSISLSAFTTLIVSNLRENTRAGARTQAVQVLNYLGRQVTGGNAAVLPDSTPLQWRYGELQTAFADLTRERQFADVNLYRASIENRGNYSGGIAGVSLVQYHISVCWNAPGGESCVRADTLGRQRVVVGSPPPSASN